jgi:hypothetical protein
VSVFFDDRGAREAVGKKTVGCTGAAGGCISCERGKNDERRRNVVDTGLALLGVGLVDGAQHPIDYEPPNMDQEGDQIDPFKIGVEEYDGEAEEGEEGEGEGGQSGGDAEDGEGPKTEAGVNKDDSWER